MLRFEKRNFTIEESGFTVWKQMSEKSRSSITLSFWSGGRFAKLWEEFDNKVTSTQRSRRKTVYQLVTDQDIKQETVNQRWQRKRQISMQAILHCWKERRTTCCPHLMKTSNTKLQVVDMIRLSCSPLRKWSIQGILTAHGSSQNWLQSKLFSSHRIMTQ